MLKRYTLMASILFLCLTMNSAFANSKTDRVNRMQHGVALYENSVKSIPSGYYQGRGIVLLGPVAGDSYLIGPEISIPPLSGFYDWQTNGDCKHFIIYDGPTALHAVYMTSDDSSANFDAGRRTRYASSSDGGVTWNSVDIPNGIRSGYGYMTLGNTGLSDGVAIVGNHYGSAPLTTYMHTDAFPLLGSFTSTISNSPNVHIWPQVNATTDGNVLVVGNTYPNGAAGDTVLTYRFDPNTGTWVGSPSLHRTSASDHTNMRWASATGPNGKAVIAVSTISDLGGSFGSNRVFYSESTDNGATWGPFNVLFDTQIDSDGDTSAAWLGMDAVYDVNGNHYISFNTTGLAGLFTTAKVWVSKNGGPAEIVIRNSDITGAMTTTAGTAQANSISVDWPSLSVSDDGNFVFCAYSVAMQDDTLNGFNSMNVYYSVSPTSALNFDGPVQVTSGLDDERYVSLNRVAITDGANTYKLPMSYQKDPQPGSTAFTDNAPLSRASLIYREITQAQTVGISNIGNTVPGSFSLEQNYPNPFNPSTTIRFGIPKVSRVTLKIYDISGKEVARLLNNQLITAGTKEYQFNASNLSSGIYFYTLEAEGFNETKKMLLVK